MSTLGGKLFKIASMSANTYFNFPNPVPRGFCPDQPITITFYYFFFYHQIHDPFLNKIN